MDNMLPVSLKTPQEVQAELVIRFKARRLAMNLTQEGLAARAGVSWGSLKRFEHTGLIALVSLLRIAHVLDCLGDFERLCANEGQAFETAMLDEILSQPKSRRKGRLK